MHKINLMQLAQQIINDYIGLKQINKSKLSKKLGISAAIITFIETGQHEKVSEEMLNIIINTLKPSNSFNIVGTANYESILNICRDSQANALMVAIIGYTGAGKTTALEDFYRHGKNVYYVSCKNSMNRKQFLAAILADLGIKYMSNVNDMVNMICDTLNRQDKPLLIIDEAGKLTTNIVLDLHDIRNDTMGNASFILSGCEYFKGNLEKKVARDVTGYPEFYSRVVNWNILSKPTKAEINIICRENGISKEDTIKEFQRLSNYRQLYNAIVNERGLE